MRVLLVDAMPLVYAAFATVGHLSTTTGIPTGMAFQFVRTVNSYKRRTQAEKVVIAWDTPEPIKKAEGHEEVYKTGRATVIEAGKGREKVDKAVMYAQIPQLKELISFTSWNQIEAPGYEADDLIGHYARQLEGAGHHVMIASTDNDLCQVVSNRVHIFLPKSEKNNVKKDGFKDLAWVRDRFGVTGTPLALYKAIAGDQSDAIRGLCDDVFGGNLNEGHLANIRAVLNLPDAPVEVDQLIAMLHTTAGTLATELEAFRDKFTKLHNLMRLHSPYADEVKLTKGARDEQGLWQVFTKLEFKSLMKDIPLLCS